MDSAATNDSAKKNERSSDIDLSGRSRWPQLQEFDWQAGRPWYMESDHRTEVPGERYEPRHREELDRERLKAWLGRWAHRARME